MQFRSIIRMISFLSEGMLANISMLRIIFSLAVSTSLLFPSPPIIADDQASSESRLETTTEEIKILKGDPPPPEKGGLSAKVVAAGEYRVGPRDVLKTEVFGVPELSDVSEVNLTGYISFPLLGTVQVDGMTTTEMEDHLEALLSRDYLQNPQVTVDIVKYQSQLVTIDGAIGRPGVYPLTGRTTFLQIILQAGGMGKLANPNEVVVFRKVEGQETVGYIVDYERVRDNEIPDPLMRAGDVVVVAESGSKAALQGANDLLKSVSGFFRFF